MLVFSALVFGVSGFLPSAHATDYAVSDKQSCEILPGTTTWNSNTCTLDSLLILSDEDNLIINWGVTFDVSSNGNLQFGGPVLNLGTITFSGDSIMFRDTIVDNVGTLIIQSGTTLTNLGELGGTGEIEIHGILINEKGGRISSLGDINNFGTIENKFRANIESDTFNHYSGAYVNNEGAIGFTFSNIDGVIDNYKQMTYAEGLSTIGPLGVINNIGPKGLIDFDQRVTVDILGKLDNFEDAAIFHGGIINNQVSGNFSNSGWVELAQTAVINNFGLLQNNLVGDVCTINECEEPYNGVIDFLSDDTNPFEIFSLVNNTGTFQNDDTIWNSCGKIVGSLTASSIPPIDACELIVGIFSPIEGSSFTDSSVIPFFGLAIDKDGFGTVGNFSANLVWTNSSNDVIGTGAGFPLTISRLGTHIITATESDSGTSSQVQIKIGFLDIDGDGASPIPPNPSVPFDCDDNDPLRFVTNTELPDGVDNDCDNVIPLTEQDNDLDGYIEDANFDFEFWFGDSSVVGGSDCDDADANRSPGLNEINDGIDNDCDEIIPFYETDDDGDSVPEYAGDCDDDNILRFFGNPEVNDGIDNDCDGLISNEEIDHDGDGYIEANPVSENHIDSNVIGGNDCNDTFPDGFPINPGAIEDSSNGYGIPGVDDNCDGIVDDNFDVDFDEDGQTFADGDCDDSNPFRYENNIEIVDGIDNDCDALQLLLPEEIDNDGDGYIIGPFDPTVPKAEWRDVNHTPDGDNDCDDTSLVAGIRYPTNSEVNDGIDNDCSETDQDDGIPLTEIDNDGDGFTEDPFDSLNGDTNVDSDVIGGGDCNDNNNTVYPGAEELPDGILNDCLGSLPGDEVDDDGDGQTELQGDCDDANILRFDGNSEVNDGIDNDCDLDIPLTEIDNDGDGYIEALTVDPNHIDGNVVGGDDCNDGNPVIHPTADELDNGIDENCNSIVDEGFDLDGDGFTPLAGRDCLDTPIESESDPRFGVVATILTTDIDSATVNQNRPELLNHVDDNCDGIIDNMSDKFTSPEFQENLDDKTIKDFEKMMDKLSHENEKLEDENRSLDKKADKYQEKADASRNAFDEEKAVKYQAKADKLYNATASNDSLIDINERQIHVIDVSINNVVVDERALLLTYENLTDKAFKDILHDIEKNFKEIEKLDEKVAKEQEKIDKELAKDSPNQEKVDDHTQHKLQAESEILIIEDLNQVLQCAINFTPEMLEKDKPDKHDKVENLTIGYLTYTPGIITDVTDKKDNVIVSSNTDTIVVKASDFDKNKFDSKIFVTSDGTTEQIHVSCSQPLFIGQTFGEYVISNLLTTNGNNSCGGHDD